MTSSEPDPITGNKRWMLYTAFASVIAWLALWGVVHLPVNRVSVVFFFCALFVAIACTFMPAIAYLNTRFGTFRSRRAYRWRFMRQSIEIGLFVVVIAWLKMRQVLNLTVASILLIVFILIETFLITREIPSQKP